LEVACSTSGFVEVVTTGPDAQRMLGITTLDVFPERVGPRTRTLL
jgi:hypothetical protein